MKIRAIIYERRIMKSKPTHERVRTHLASIETLPLFHPVKQLLADIEEDMIKDNDYGLPQFIILPWPVPMVENSV